MIAVAIATMLPATSAAYNFCSLTNQQISADGVFIYERSFWDTQETITWSDERSTHSWSYDGLSGSFSHKGKGLWTAQGDSFTYSNCPVTLDVNNHTYQLLTLAAFYEDGTPTSYTNKADTIYGHDDGGQRWGTLIVPIYVREDWTVTFNANSGSVSPTSKAITRKSKYGALPTPTRTGYSFAGWYTAASGGSKITASSDYSLADDQTLYARWTAKKSALTFTANGGSGTMTTGLSATYGSAMPTPVALPTRTGYTFQGYYDATSGGTQYYTSAGASARSWNKDTTSGTTLYAHWTAKQSALTFNANGGSGTMTTGLSATYGSAMPTPINLPTRAGYTFAGFYDATSGGTKYYNANGTSATTWNKNTTSGTTLYARWTANSYTVAFNANGGAGSMSNQSFTYGVSQALTANSFTRTGYTFAGWNRNADGTGTSYSDKQSVSNLTTTSGGTVTLYAKWTANKYTVTFKANGGPGSDTTKEVTYGSQYGSLPTPTYGGNTFNGWYTAATGGSKVTSTTTVATAQNHNLYAHWTANTYTVTLDKQSGTGGTDSVTATYNAAMPALESLPTRTGYAFNGYYDAASGGTQYYKADGASAKTWDKTGAQTLYAQWTANTYTVTLNQQSGTGGTSSVTATYGSAMPALESQPTRTGYTFAGYYDATSGGTKYYNADGTSAKTWDKTGAQTLYARWTANTYKVTLDRQGGTDGSASVTATYGNSMPAIQVPTRNGYTFGGYYDQTNGGGTQYYNADGSSAKAWDKATATTLYAKWTAKTYTITFNANGGEGGTCQELEYGATIDAPTVTREGYTFSGWSPSVPATVSGTATYEAQWTVNKYTITFDANGGDGGTSKELEYGAAIAAPTVTREGYTLSVWQPAVPDTVPASNATYVAQWIADLRVTITFEVEGGEFADPVTNSVNTVYTNGYAYGWLPMATKENHEFAGWWTTPEPTNRVQQLATDTATNTISKLYARWKHIPPTVTVTADDNSTNVVWGTEFGDLKLMPSTVPDGKDFAWWCDTEGKPISDDYVVTNDIIVKPRWSVATLLDNVAFETNGWSYSNGGFRSKDFTKAKSKETMSLIAYIRYAGAVSFDYSACLSTYSIPGFAETQALFVWRKDDDTDSSSSISSGETCGSTNVFARDKIELTISGNGANSINDYAAISNIQYSIATSEWVDAWCSTNSSTRTLKLVTPAEAGVLSFKWRVNGETGYVDTNGVYRLCDRLSFRELGGTPLRVEGFSEENGFTHVCVTNETASSHVFVWRYEKDFDCDAGDDAAWIKDIVWTPLAPSAEDTVIEYTSLDGTEMTVSIPNDWVDEHNLRTGEMSYSDAVGGISATSGLPYWVGYIIGEDPDAELRITDFAVHAGTISIGWAPNRPDRVYTICGKTNLTDAAWHTPTNSATRFFTVEVSMPK